MRNRTGKSQRARQWRQWTEDAAREVLAELASSGESMAEFSRETGFSRSRLAYWKKRVAMPKTTDFVAVDVSEPATTRCFEIVASGVVLRVREDLEVDHVAQLVEAILQRRPSSDPPVDAFVIQGAAA